MVGALTALVVFGATFQVAQAQSSSGVGEIKTAPDFSGRASDGKTYSLASVKKTKKPTLLYFIGHTCPVNASAVKYFNALGAAYKGKVNFLGVIDADAAAYKNWQARFKAPYPVIFDPNMTIIERYGTERSPWAILVDANGRIVDEWHGYSVAYINGMSSKIATTAKTPVKQVDTAGAPTQTRYG